MRDLATSTANLSLTWHKVSSHTMPQRTESLACEEGIGPTQTSSEGNEIGQRPHATDFHQAERQRPAPFLIAPKDDQQRLDKQSAVHTEGSLDEWVDRVQEFVNGIAASVAIIKHDDSGEFVVSACNDSFLSMLGGRRSDIRDFPVSLNALLPSHVRMEFHRKLLECFRSNAAQELKQAYDLKDGTHWWRLSLKPFRHSDADVHTHEILVEGLDITKKVNLAHELEVSTSRFRSVVDAASDAITIITINQQHNVTSFNRAAEELFGYDSSEVTGQPLLQLIPEAYRKHHSEHIERFARSSDSSRDKSERRRIYGRRRDGSSLPLEIVVSKISVGGLQEFTAVIRDISDRVRLMDVLPRQAGTNVLAGLPNRWEFLEIVEVIMRTKNDLAILMLDIDFLGKIDDTYGDGAREKVLRTLAEMGTFSSRTMDIFARWGDEKFVVALPLTSLEQARSMAERLRTKCERRDFTHNWPAGAVPFTISIGVATQVPGERDFNAILGRADQALRKAREMGGNRVEAGDWDRL